MFNVNLNFVFIMIDIKLILHNSVCELFSMRENNLQKTKQLLLLLNLKINLKLFSYFNALELKKPKAFNFSYLKSFNSLKHCILNVNLKFLIFQQTKNY